MTSHRSLMSRDNDDYFSPNSAERRRWSCSWLLLLSASWELALALIFLAGVTTAGPFWVQLFDSAAFLRITGLVLSSAVTNKPANRRLVFFVCIEYEFQGETRGWWHNDDVADDVAGRRRWWRQMMLECSWEAPSATHWGVALYVVTGWYRAVSCAFSSGLEFCSSLSACFF